MIFTRIPYYSINSNQQKNPIKNPLIHWEYNQDQKKGLGTYLKLPL
jgi:hypothetical protein